MQVANANSFIKHSQLARTPVHLLTRANRGREGAGTGCAANNNTIIAATALSFLLNAKNVERKSTQATVSPQNVCLQLRQLYTHTPAHPGTPTHTHSRRICRNLRARRLRCLFDLPRSVYSQHPHFLSLSLSHSRSLSHTLMPRWFI